MRNFLTEKKLWTEEHELELIEKFDEDIKEAVAQADAAPKQLISDSLKTMFETPTDIIQEQIEQFEIKEGK